MQRNQGESFEDYKIRRNAEKEFIKNIKRRAFIVHKNNQKLQSYRKDVHVFDCLQRDLSKEDFFKLCQQIATEKKESKFVIQRAQQYLDSYLKEKQSAVDATDC